MREPIHERCDRVVTFARHPLRAREADCAILARLHRENALKFGDGIREIPLVHDHQGLEIEHIGILRQRAFEGFDLGGRKREFVGGDHAPGKAQTRIMMLGFELYRRSKGVDRLFDPVQSAEHLAVQKLRLGIFRIAGGQFA